MILHEAVVLLVVAIIVAVLAFTAIGGTAGPKPAARYHRQLRLSAPPSTREDAIKRRLIAASLPPIRLLKCSAHFAGLPCSRHNATRSETFASPTHMTVSAPPQ
jgi:hypothetical protein